MAKLKLPAEGCAECLKTIRGNAIANVLDNRILCSTCYKRLSREKQAAAAADPNEADPRFVDLHTKVHGVSHENDNGSDRQDNIEMCAVGDIVSLIREPANEFDRNAIAVYAPGVGQIGFVSSALSEDLAPAMDRGTFILAEISDVTGGTEEKPMWGVNLRLRQTTEESVAAAIRQQCDVAESRKAARRAAMAGYDARMRAVKKPWFSWFKC